MKKITLILVLALMTLTYNCSSGSDNANEVAPSEIDFDWNLPFGTVLGSFNLFPLAENPVLTKASEVNFISDVSKVALVGLKDEIRIYPYRFISTFECVNDIIGGKNITLSYCPLTQSAISWQTNFKGETLILRSSGYLHHDNLIAYDENSDTYWSQMLSRSVKGQYGSDNLPNFNVIETNWALVKQYFPNAMVFTNSSVTSKSSENNKTNGFEDGDNVYGIVDASFKDNSKIHIYKYNEFIGDIKIYEKFIDTKKVIVIGNAEKHFITSYINDSAATFSAVQNNFPVIMEDTDGNQWNLFGVAISGPRQGDQLGSPLSYVALGWAWRAFFSDFALNE